MAILSLLWTLAICGLIAWILWWALNKYPLPEPFNAVARAALVIASVIIVISIILGAFIIPFPAITLK